MRKALICEVEGCPDKIRMCGRFCAKHGLRYKRHGDPLAGRTALDTPLIDRFKAKFTETKSGCWKWLDHLDHSGYGKFRVDGKLVFAHRWSYAYFNGELVPGLEIDHMCHNPACVNPEHLRQVTKSVNQHNRAKPTGVRQRGSRFAAVIKVNKKDRWLGTYDTREEAQSVVDSARKEALEAALGGA